MRIPEYWLKEDYNEDLPAHTFVKPMNPDYIEEEHRPLCLEDEVICYTSKGFMVFKKNLIEEVPYYYR